MKMPIAEAPRRPRGAENSTTETPQPVQGAITAGEAGGMGMAYRGRTHGFVLILMVMVKAEVEFAETVKGWLDQAEITDMGEDFRFRNRQGGELPAGWPTRRNG
jgi:hypothetical protein